MNSFPTPTQLLSCDWGTSHLRLRLVESSRGAVLAELRSDEGVGRIAAETAPDARAEAFRQTLARRVHELSEQVGRDLSGLPVLISGMASSSIGWRELPYAQLPFALDGQGLVWEELEPLTPGGGGVLLVSGVRDAADVMRGEETEILGLSQLPVAEILQNEAVVILPGTHSKHVQIRGGRVVGFQTYMTGELFDLLRQHSSLRHSTRPPTTSAANVESDPAAGEEAFCAGVRHAAEKPLTAALFQVRTRQLLQGAGAAENTAYLSGLLIGAELSGLRRADAASMLLLLCAGAALARPYELGFQTLGLTSRLRVLPPDEVETLSARGQSRLWQRWRQKADACVGS